MREYDNVIYKGLSQARRAGLDKNVCPELRLPWNHLSRLFKRVAKAVRGVE